MRPIELKIVAVFLAGLMIGFTLAVTCYLGIRTVAQEQYQKQHNVRMIW